MSNRDSLQTIRGKILQCTFVKGKSPNDPCHPSKHITGHVEPYFLLCVIRVVLTFEIRVTQVQFAGINNTITDQSCTLWKMGEIKKANSTYEKDTLWAYKININHKALTNYLSTVFMRLEAEIRLRATIFLVIPLGEKSEFG